MKSVIYSISVGRFLFLLIQIMANLFHCLAFSDFKLRFVCIVIKSIKL